MNHALRWTHDQVPLEARGAAREAARREGKTLSQWLHDVVESYAAALGQPARLLKDADRAEAIALRLRHISKKKDRLGSRGDLVPQKRETRSDFAVESRRYMSHTGSLPERQRRAIPDVASQHRLLDQALDILSSEQRSQPFDDDPWASYEATARERRATLPPSAEPETRRPAPSTEARESFRHLDNKLDSILQAVQTRPVVWLDPNGLTTSSGVDRRFPPTGPDIVEAAAPRRSVRDLDPPSKPAPRAVPPKVRSGFEGELVALCSEISETLRQHRDRREGISRNPHTAPSATVERPAARREPPAPPPTIPSPSVTPRVLPDAPPAVPRPAENAALTAVGTLQRQMAELSSRVHVTDAYRVKIETIDRQLAKLAADHATAAGRIEASAASAARAAIEAAMNDGRFAALDAVAQEVADSRTRRDIADDRTKSTLEAVCATLEKVAERLVSVETGMASALATTTAAAPVPAPPTAPPSQAPIGPALADIPPSPPKLETPTVPTFERASAPKFEQSAIERDFIAQARRSANAARKPAVDMRRPIVQPTPVPPPPGFAQQAQTYLTRHRRPIGIGLAATCVIAGLTEMANLSGVGPSDNVAIASARVVEQTQPATNDAPSREPPAAAPSNLASLNNMAFGRDPLQTASFTKAPTGASEFSVQPPPLPDSGPAAYLQGDAFAAGRGMPRDFARAALAFQRAADLGIVPAEVRLAALYEKGLGVGRDRDKAKALYAKAADAGNPLAMHNLAVLLTDGAGHPDYVNAAMWFRKAAQFGVHDSQFNLGVFYAEGLGVAQSFRDSYQWFAIAALQGDDAAAKKRDLVAARLAPNELLVAKALVDAFHPRRPDPAAVAVPHPGPGEVATAAFNRV